MPEEPVATVSAIPLPQLVSALYELHAQRDALQADILKAEAVFLAKGKGKYVGLENGQVLSVDAGAAPHPGATIYVLDSEDEAEARQLASEKFLTLFERKVTHTPREGFATFARELLTPAKARDLIALCQTTGKPYSGRKATVKLA